MLTRHARTTALRTLSTITPDHPRPECASALRRRPNGTCHSSPRCNRGNRNPPTIPRPNGTPHPRERTPPVRRSVGTRGVWESAIPTVGTVGWDEASRCDGLCRSQHTCPSQSPLSFASLRLCASLSSSGGEGLHAKARGRKGARAQRLSAFAKAPADRLADLPCQSRSRRQVSQPRITAN